MTIGFIPGPNQPAVEVIDTATNTVIATILTPGTNPFGVAITPDGSRVFVTNDGGSNTITVIDTATNTIDAGSPVAVGNAPLGIAITPDGTTAFFANNADATVSEINTATLAVPGTIASPSGSTFTLAITPDGINAYVTGQGSNSVDVLQIVPGPPTFTISIPVLSGPTGIAITPDGNFAYVSQSDTTTVAIIDLSTNAIIATVGVGNAPAGIAFASVSSSGGFVVSGECKKNQFLTESDLFNVIRWSPPPGAIPTQYKIFCGSVLIATLPGSTLQFEHHNLKKNKSYSYSVFAEDETGTIASGTITIKCH